MNTLLWTLIVNSVLHIVGLIVNYYRGQPWMQPNRTAMALGSAYTIAVGLWALWLVSAQAGL